MKPLILLLLFAVGCDNTVIERELGTLKAQLAEQEAIKARFTPDLAKRNKKNWRNCSNNRNMPNSVEMGTSTITSPNSKNSNGQQPNIWPRARHCPRSSPT